MPKNTHKKIEEITFEKILDHFRQSIQRLTDESLVQPKFARDTGSNEFLNLQVVTQLNNSQREKFYRDSDGSLHTIEVLEQEIPTFIFRKRSENSDLLEECVVSFIQDPAEQVMIERIERPIKSFGDGNRTVHVFPLHSHGHRIGKYLHQAFSLVGVVSAGILLL